MASPPNDAIASMHLALTSPILSARAVRHGFSTRLGGVSDGAFSSLNLAVAPGDERDKLDENLRRFSRAIGADPSRLYQTSQVHGSTVREVVDGDDRVSVVREEADALVTRSAKLAVGVRVADCVPVLLFDEASGAVAAVHAGWRGVVGGVVGAGVAALLAGRSPRSILAAIGPSIGPCCFEVGADIATTIDDASPGGGVIARRAGDKAFVDLRRAVRRQLVALGIDDGSIDDVAGCTRCDEERFFSFRRDGARSGRHLAAIVAP